MPYSPLATDLGSRIVAKVQQNRKKQPSERMTCLADKHKSSTLDLKIVIGYSVWVSDMAYGNR